MTHTKRHTYHVGIEYDSPDENQGFFNLQRTVTFPDLVREVARILKHGHRYPRFPASAHPEVVYAWDLSDPDDGDCTPELTAALERLCSPADSLQKR